MSTIFAVILTLFFVGGATGIAAYNVMDRSSSGGTTEDGAVVEPLYESPSPVATDEPDQQAPRQGTTQQQPTQRPTTVVVIPQHTATATPHETAEQDEDFQTDPPTEEPHTTDDFDSQPESS